MPDVVGITECIVYSLLYLVHSLRLKDNDSSFRVSVCDTDQGVLEYSVIITYGKGLAIQRFTAVNVKRSCSYNFWQTILALSCQTSPFSQYVGEHVGLPVIFTNNVPSH